jgi:flagellar motor switch/type III secretory pathway protein FliN
VEIQHQQRITIPYTQEFAMMETQSHSAKQSLWDNLMIEVDASFEPIKLPLKQLKQMTEGLVIEMGDLVHNRIALQVEGKTLAWGELLIVGDKFAVRINQVATNPGAEEAASHSGHVGALPADSSAALLPAAQGGIAEEAHSDQYLDKDFDEIADDDEEDW